MGVEVRSKDNSDAVRKMLEQLAHKEVRVGFFEHSKYPDGTPIAYVAAVQELGYGPIPPRPFMRPAEQQNKVKWVAGIAKGVSAALDGSMTIDHALEQVGMVAAADVKKAIKAVTAPALSDATIRARASKKKSKGNVSAKPLVDTGQMIQAVTSVVVTE